MSDEQMRSDRFQYPVDRYLVNSSEKVEMVNILDGEIWNPEPALKPEDEIVLRKLHDMLQSTADDLKLLSGELSKYQQPGVQLKSQPTPLDEEFNEKVHIEEIVNAKFHGYKIVEESLPFSQESIQKKDFVNKMLARRNYKPKAVNASIQVNSVSSLKKQITSKNLQTTRPKIVHIKEDKVNSSKESSMKDKKTKSSSTISYNEIAYQYVENEKEISTKSLQIQNMPTINIRSELKEQKVLQLDILPDCPKDTEISSDKKNIGVVTVKYECPKTNPTQGNIPDPPRLSHTTKKPTTRKVSKISYESSESTNNMSSEGQRRLENNKLAVRNAAFSARSNNRNKKIVNTRKTDLRSNWHLDEWKKKLNSVYGQHISNKTSTLPKTKKLSPKKMSSSARNLKKPESNILNNTDYIPYSQLTLGGVRVSDIEREISEIPDRGDLPLNPIVNKILGSKENSFHKYNPTKNKIETGTKVLTTSDENLLQEVMEIEKTISETLSKTVSENVKNAGPIVHNEDTNSREDNIYADDFEDVKSDVSDLNSSASKKQISFDEPLDDSYDIFQNENIDRETEKLRNKNQEENIQNTTYTKASNLSFKDEVDIFEFVHSVDTQETGTQSNTTNKISLKETQTSPRNDRSNFNIQPIHNDLWSSIDPKGEVEKLLQLEKEFIKKLIVDEYGEILEKNITKPSTSNQKDREDRDNNVKTLQKNTQTSPAHVKCVMTSPTRTKTRTTSPFSLYTTDHPTSPLQISDEESKIIIDNEPEDVGISINLSSPRFSLRLPQNSREVISNLDNYSRTPTKINEEGNKLNQETKTFRNYAISSSSSVDADNSSSEISSLGEVRLKLRRKLKRTRVHSVVASSSSSVVSRNSDVISGDILPLKSEGELSLGQTTIKSRGRKNSDGEMNFEAR